MNRVHGDVGWDNFQIMAPGIGGWNEKNARLWPQCPRFLPWSVVLPHWRQAQDNHMQTLERLHERGGLSPCEILAVLEDRKWYKMDHNRAVKQLAAKHNAYKVGRKQ